MGALAARDQASEAGSAPQAARRAITSHDHYSQRPQQNMTQGRDASRAARSRRPRLGPCWRRDSGSLRADSDGSRLPVRAAACCPASRSQDSLASRLRAEPRTCRGPCWLKDSRSLEADKSRLPVWAAARCPTRGKRFWIPSPEIIG
jgi:hypothetical protein